jgi:HK97 family phage major capsid protein
MTLLEMRDKRGLLVTDNAEMLVKIKKENREFTADEKKAFDENVKLSAQLEKDILVEEELRKVPEKKDKEIKMSAKEKRFSLMGSILNQVENRPMDSEYIPLFEEGRNEFKKSGLSTKGNIVLPYESRASIVTGQTTGTTAGGYIVQTDKKTVLPPLTNYLVLTKAGATYMTGLVGNVSIPTYSGTTVLWKGEVETAVDGAGTWGKVDLNPKRLTAFIDVSTMFLQQDSVGAENMLMENIAKAVACKLESTILGLGAGSVATEPAGLFYGVTKPDTLTNAIAVGLETSVDSSNALAGNLAYITNAAGRGLLKTTPVVATYTSKMICENNEINGYPLLVSNGVAGKTAFTTTGGDGLIFGNWSDLIIGQWGGYDILVDPYTQAALGTVRIIVNSFFDAAVARSVSFAKKAIK